MQRSIEGCTTNTRSSMFCCKSPNYPSRADIGETFPIYDCSWRLRPFPTLRSGNLHTAQSRTTYSFAAGCPIRFVNRVVSGNQVARTLNRRFMTR
jgi:hypothetical protein